MAPTDTAYDPAAVCPDEACTATVRHWHRSHGDRIVRCTHRTYRSDTCLSYPRCYEPRPQRMSEWDSDPLEASVPRETGRRVTRAQTLVMSGPEGPLPESITLTLGDETRVYVPVAPEPDPEVVDRMEAAQRDDERGPR